MIGVDLNEGVDLLSARYFVVRETTANASCADAHSDLREAPSGDHEPKSMRV